VTGTKPLQVQIKRTRLTEEQIIGLLYAVDDVTLDCLASVLDASMSDRRVVRELAELIAQRSKPGMIVSDNGTEPASNALLVAILTCSGNVSRRACCVERLCRKL
jgi:hypothetical protein